MTASKKNIGSDLAKVDAYVNTPADYQELPELDGEFFERAVRHEGGVPPRMGRPPIGDAPKKQVTLRLDPKVIDTYRSSGPGWQAKMNDVLAARDEVVDFIEKHEAAASAMRKLLRMFHDGDLPKPKVKGDVGTLEGVERQIAMTDEAAHVVRRILNEHTPKK